MCVLPIYYFWNNIDDPYPQLANTPTPTYIYIIYIYILCIGNK